MLQRRLSKLMNTFIPKKNDRMIKTGKIQQNQPCQTISTKLTCVCVCVCVCYDFDYLVNWKKTPILAPHITALKHRIRVTRIFATDCTQVWSAKGSEKTQHFSEKRGYSLMENK